MPAKARLARSIPRIDVRALPSLPGLPQVDPRAWFARIAPTRRSLAIGLGLLAFAFGGYLLARETSMFAIDRIDVRGGPPSVAIQVRRVLASDVGQPLVGLDGSAVLQKVDALPSVVSASYNRDFPHTLRIAVVAERPAVVLRRGSDSWLLSTRGRVMERLPSALPAKLPRLWISSRTSVRTGSALTVVGAVTAAHAVGQAGPFAARIASVSGAGGALVFRLRSGLELLLGNGGDVKLKVAVAERVLRALPPGSTFLDVSGPGRAVSGTGSPLLNTPRSSSRG